MAQLKTTRRDDDVDAFLQSVADERRRADALEVTRLMTDITAEKPAMWGSSIIGFGQRHLRYASGRELDWFVVGLSPRKQSLTLYLTEGFEAHEETLTRLGPHSTGKSCLYIKRLDQVDRDVLTDLIEDAWRAGAADPS